MNKNEIKHENIEFTSLIFWPLNPWLCGSESNLFSAGGIWSDHFWKSKFQRPKNGPKVKLQFFHQILSKSHAPFVFMAMSKNSFFGPLSYDQRFSLNLYLPYIGWQCGGMIGLLLKTDFLGTQKWSKSAFSA